MNRPLNFSALNGVTTLVLLLALNTAVQATPYYWDIDQATAGAGGGASPTGTWSTAATTLSTDINGTSAVVAHTTGTGDSVTFSAGATATGAYTVTVSGAQNIGTLTFEDGLPSLTGSAINFNNGAGTGTFNVNVDTDINNVIAGANLVKNGTGTLTWSGTGTNTYTASLTVNAGTLNLKGQHTDDGNTRVLTIQNNSTVNLQTGATETLIGSDQLNMGGSIAGTQNFNVAGTLNLHGSNSTIIAQNAASLTSILTVQSGGVVDVTTANLILGNNNATANGTLTVQAGGSVTVNSSAGAISLGRAGATGTLNLDGGTFATGLTILGSNSGTTGTATVNFNGGTLKAITANNANWVNPSSNGGTGKANIKAGGAKFDTNGLSMGIAQALLHDAALGATPDGGLTLNDTNATPGTLTLSSAANAYTGDTTVSKGTLKLGANNVIPDGAGFGNLVLNPSSGTATFDVAGFTEGINGLSSSGAGSSVVNNSGGAVTLTVGNNNATSTFNGVIQNTGSALSLTKTGNGTLTLGGANTYTGATNVNGGTLQFAAGGSINNAAAINVTGAAANNATLSIAGGSVTTSGVMDVGGVLNQPGAVTISGGSLTLTGGGTHFMGSDTSTNSTTANATFTQTGGTVAITGSLFTGNSATSSQISVNNTGSSFTLGGTLYLGIVNGGSGALTIGTTGLPSVSLGALNLGYSSGSSGAVTMNGGTLTVTSSSVIGGTNTGGTGTWTQSGGSVTFNNQVIVGNIGASNAGAGSVTVSAGAFTQQTAGIFYVGVGSGNTGTLTINGSGNVSLRQLNLGYQAGTTSLINLDGGTLKLFNETGGNGGSASLGTSTFNFNGGTLQAGATFTAPTGVSTVVKSLGAKIDTNGFNITIPTALIDGGGGGGGLTKTGNGILTLTGANTFTGAVAVNTGTLNVGGGGATGAIPTTAVTVASGALLKYDLSTAFTSAPLSVTGNLEYTSAARLTLNAGTYGANQLTATGTDVLVGGNLVINAGAGGATITGTNSTAAGITSTTSRNITTTGNVTFVGSMTGNSTFVDGISLAGTYTATTGTLSFDGTAGSTSGYGIEDGVSGSWASVNNSTFGNVTFKGTGGTGRNSDINMGNLTGNGTVTLIGRSKGLNTLGTFTASGGLPYNVVIQTTAGGINGLLGAGTDTTGNGNYSVTSAANLVQGGRTVNAGNGTISLSATTQLNLTGTLTGATITGSGNNISVDGATTINAGAGGATFTGTSASVAGISLPSAGKNITSTGTVTFIGTTSAGSFVDGMSLGGVYTASSGTLTFDGTSAPTGAYGIEAGVSGAFGASISTIGNVTFKGTGGTTRNSDLNLGNLTGNGTVTLIGRLKGLNTVGTFTASGGLPYNVVIQTTNGASINGLLGAGTDTTGNGNYSVTSAAQLVQGGRIVNAGNGTISLGATTQLNLNGSLTGATITGSGTNISVDGNLIINAGAGGATFTGTSTSVAGVSLPSAGKNITSTGNVTFTGTTTAGSFIDGISLGGVYTATTGTLTFDGTAAPTGAYGIEAGVSGAFAASISTIGNVVFKGTGGTTRNSDLNLGNLTGNGTVTLIGRSKGLNTNETFTATGGLPYNVVIQTAAGGINGLLGAGTDTTGNGNYTVSSAGSVVFGGRTVNAGSGAISLTSATGYSVTSSSTLQSATLAINDSNSIALSSGATLTLDTTASIANTISGLGSLTKSGAGTVTLGGANTYGGATIVSGGTLNLNGTHSSATTFRVENSATVNIAGTETLTGAAGLNMGNSTTGTNAVNVSGTLNLHGTGGTLVGQNAVTTATLTIQSGGLVDVANGGFILGNNNGSAIGIVTVQAGGALTFNDNAGGADAFILGRSGAQGTVNLDGGTITTPRSITKGTGTATFNFNGGTLKTSAANATLMTGLTRANVRNGGAIIDTNGLDSTIDQALLHSNIGGDNPIDGGLAKNGNGTLQLTNTNTYTGATNVNAGTLNLNGSIATSSLTTVKSGAWLTGIGTTGALTIDFGGTHAPGNSPGITTVMGNYIMNGTLNIEIASPSGSVAGADYDQVKVLSNGSVALGGSSTLNVSYTGGAGTFNPGFAQVYTIIDNDGTAASDTVGMFGNYGAEGSSVTIDGKILKLYYHDGSTPASGDFNNVVLVSTNGSASTLYVNDQWTSAATVDGNAEAPNSQTAFVGVDAWSTTDAAFASLTSPPFNGTLVLNGNNSGTPYNVNLSHANAGNVIVNLVADLPNGENNVTIGTLTGAAGDAIVLDSQNSGNGNLTVANGAFGGGISGIGTLTKNTAGTLTLSGPNSYTGVTTVNGGVLNIASNTGLGTTAGGTNVNNGATLQLSSVAVGAEALTLEGVGAAGTGALLVDGGTSSYAGAITLEASSTIGVRNSGTLTLTGGINKAGFNVTFLGNGAATNTANINTVGISGAADVIVDGMTVNYNTSNSYVGPTTIQNGGILNANVASALPTGTFSAVSISATSKLNLNNGVPQTVASLSGAGTVDNTAVGTNTLTIEPAAGSTNFSGAIKNSVGTLNVVKNGAGTQQLSGVNTYTGSTTVTAGTLALTAGSLQNSNVAVTGGAFQQTGGKNNVTGGAGVGDMVLNGGTYSLSGTGELDFRDYVGTVGGGTAWVPNNASTLQMNNGLDFSFTGGSLFDVSLIDTNGTTFTQGGGQLFVGRDESNNSPAQSAAALTELDNNFTQLAGIIELDVFGEDLTPEDCCDAGQNDALLVQGTATLGGTTRLHFVDFTPEFGDIFNLMCADAIVLQPGFGIDGGFFRVVPTGNADHPFALQAIVPEPASIAVWTLVGLAGAAGAWRLRRKKR